MYIYINIYIYIYIYIYVYIYINIYIYNMYIYRVFKKVKKKIFKCFNICLHQSIFFTTHLKNLYYILQRYLQ